MHSFLFIVHVDCIGIGER